MDRYTEEFKSRLNHAGAVWDESHATPLHYGMVDHDYWSVRDGGFGVADCSDRETLVITGKDVITWAQGLFTNDVMQLEQEGSGQRTFAVTRVGRVMADLRLLHLPQMLMVDMEPGALEDGAFITHLKHHIIMEDVKLSVVSDQVAKLGVFGHGVPKLLGLLCHGAPRRASALGEYEGTWGRISGVEVVVQQTPLVGVPGFYISCDRELVHKVWDALMEASEQMRPVGAQALEVMRLEAGEVKYGKELHAKVIPIEADLNRYINYEKGCYLGQEVIHRLDTQGKPAKMLRLLKFASGQTSPKVGAKIESGQKKVGEVLAVFQSPIQDDALFAWGYLKRPVYSLDQEVEVEGSGPALVQAIGANREDLQAF